ncbi:TraB/GumN family protein [Ideonella oryzae]|uniref:TraB/GumN family protein n=1 Tax=Ideonella oryzae TaxID=2937441 RepID=A0ABT1BPP8_9BURK|nr:TraB/GumN family protein [Ideonella oryzae]MCO5978196.1 TraB/GumN family protein [Ideonella oryzae]
MRRLSMWGARLCGLGLALLATLSGGSARADCPPAAVPPDAQAIQQGMAQAQNHGFLWTLDRQGHRSWLYGTLHAAQQAWMYPGPAVLKALGQTRRLVVELDMSDPATLAALPRLARQTPDRALSPALEARLQKAEDAACLGRALKDWRPEMRVTTLSVMSLRDEGIDPAWGVDGLLIGMAKGLKLPVTPLETPAQQMAALLQPRRSAAEALVRDTLDEMDRGDDRRTLRRLAQAWADGHLDELETYPQWCDCLNSPQEKAMMRRLLSDRNGPMADKIARLHGGEGGLFVAVGSLHMVGPQGLPVLLAARGFTVTRVRWPSPALAAVPAAASGAESASSAASSGAAQELVP